MSKEQYSTAQHSRFDSLCPKHGSVKKCKEKSETPLMFIHGSATYRQYVSPQAMHPVKDNKAQVITVLSTKYKVF